MEQLRTVAQEASDARQLASQYAPNDEMHELALEECLPPIFFAALTRSPSEVQLFAFF